MIAAPRRANIAAASLVVLAAVMPIAGARAQSAVGIAEGDGIFIDGRNFEIVHRKSGGGAGQPSDVLGAREIGPGAIIYRVGDRLYIVDATARLPAGPQHDPISVAYEAPKNPEHQKVYELVKERRVLEILK